MDADLPSNVQNVSFLARKISRKKFISYFVPRSSQRKIGTVRLHRAHRLAKYLAHSRARVQPPESRRQVETEHVP